MVGTRGAKEGVPSAALVDAATAALQRAMPYTRLTDCGMNPADAATLLEVTTEGQSWPSAASTLADHRSEAAATAERAGHRATALQSAKWAAAAALFAQMAENSDTPLKVRLYRRYVELVTQVADLRTPRMERLELDHANGKVVGWLCLPATGTARGTVVVWGGLSGWGAAYLPMAEALSARGLACILAEGPGQGEARIQHKLYVDSLVADGFARFIDFVAADARLGDAVGVCGNSFGGLFAAHLAAGDTRVGACVVNGAPAAPELPSFRTARDQLAAAMGTEDEAQLAAILDGLRFDPQSHPIDCPVLVLHGDRDPLLPEEGMQRPFAEAAGPRGALLAWPDGEHTLYNRAAERDALLTDWFADQLLH